MSPRSTAQRPTRSRSARRRVHMYGRARPAPGRQPRGRNLGQLHYDTAPAADRPPDPNRYVTLVDRNPDRFLAFVVLPLPHVEAALAELDRVLDAPGVVGVALTAAAP
ncbi:amidohydrolase family protein [Streptomyces sp. NPDC002680]|uniref:amidohydrolase family protein n=1 Tax=Streptomyces sp. NPDC002680 TaxID=3364659 RepID=UPI0036757802